MKAHRSFSGLGDEDATAIGFTLEARNGKLGFYYGSHFDALAGGVFGAFGIAAAANPLADGFDEGGVAGRLRK